MSLACTASLHVTSAVELKYVYNNIYLLHRKDGGLPDGVTVEKDILRFDRPLRLTDSGVYKCVATNVVGSGKVDIKIEVAGMYLCF